MKKTILLSIAILVIANSSAQTTIGGYTGTIAGTSDSLKPISVTSLLSLSLPPAANHSWDMGSLNYQSGFIVNAHSAIPSGITAFPAALYTDSVVYSITAGADFNVNDMFENTSTYLIRLGGHVNHQNISLASLTGNPGDSIVFPTQDIISSRPDTLIKFPFTFNSSWSSTSRVVTNFNVTVTSFLTNAPAQRITTIAMKDTVVGWGKMKVKNASGALSNYMDVLQVEKTVSYTDSFYLYGAPADSAELAGFGLSQGQVTTQYNMDFYRAGEIVPLVSIAYGDSTYKAPTSGTVHVQRLPYSTAVPQASVDETIQVFPNPVAHRQVSVVLPETIRGSWSYKLINIEGKVLANAKLVSASGPIPIILPSVPSGVYYLQLNCEEKTVCAKQLNILE